MANDKCETHENVHAYAHNVMFHMYIVDRFKKEKKKKDEKKMINYILYYCKTGSKNRKVFNLNHEYF